MRAITFLKGALLGAGFMYLFDPDRGRARRAGIRDAAVHTWNSTGDAVETKMRDLGNRAQGAVHNAVTALSPGGVTGREPVSPDVPAWMPARWSPQTRLIVAASAGLLAAYGKRRGGWSGLMLSTVGLAVIGNTVSRAELKYGPAFDAPALPSDLPPDSLSGNEHEHLPREARNY